MPESANLGWVRDSIQTIQKTSSSGLKDTYTMTFKSGSQFTFDVTNGATQVASETFEEINTPAKWEAVRNFVSNNFDYVLGIVLSCTNGMKYRLYADMQGYGVTSIFYHNGTSSSAPFTENDAIMIYPNLFSSSASAGELWNCDVTIIYCNESATEAAVPESRTIAGINLEDDITKAELQNALDMGDLVPKTRTIAGVNLESDVTKDEFVKSITSDDINSASDLVDAVLKKSINLYNPALQTPATISPHYYVNGYPYSSTEYDSFYNCTALFEIKPSTTYYIKVFNRTFTKPWNAASHGIFFYDEDGNYISGSSNNSFTTPSNARYARFNYFVNYGNNPLSFFNANTMIVEGSTEPSSYVAYSHEYYKDIFQNNIDGINEQIDFYNSKFYVYSPIQDLTFTSGTCWSVNIHNFYGADWSYAIIDLSQYSIKQLSVKSYTNSACPAIVFFRGDPLNGGTYISYMLAGSDPNTIEMVTATDIEIPEGCTYILFQYKNGYAGSCYFDGKQFVNLSPSGSTALPIYATWDKTNAKLTVNTRFNSTKDLCVELGKRGVNSIFDFTKWSFNNNSNHYPIAVSSGTLYASNGTDFFGPWIVSAVNNADGDQTGSGNFTGGNHGYDNTGSTVNNSATGRTVSVEVRIDGDLCDEFTGYCSRIDIYWVNRVQAFNTTKQNGTGREVLEERYHMSFDGHTWQVEGNPVMLEDVKVLTYYGLQFAGFGSINSTNKVEYYGDDKDSTYNANANSQATSKNCLGMVYKDISNNFKCTIFVDNVKGLGRGALNSDTSFSLFYSSYGKGYANFIRNSSGESISQGTSMYFSGSYVFEPILL